MKLTCMAALAATALAAVPAAAAVFSFDVVVTESIDVSPPPDVFVPEYDLPDLGGTGTVTFTLDDAYFATADPIPNEFVDISAFLSVTASIGNLTAALEEPAIFAFPNRTRFSNGDFANIVVNVPTSVTDATLAGSFTAFNDSFGVPATLADIPALLGDANTLMQFSFNGTVNGGDFVSFRAESITPVPLPAGALLMLTGIAGLGVASRRRKVG